MITPNDFPGARPTKCGRYYHWSGVGLLFTFGGVSVHALRERYPPEFFTCVRDAYVYIARLADPIVQE